MKIILKNKYFYHSRLRFFGFLTELLFFIFTSPNTAFSQCKTENLLVCIDGKSRLHIKGNKMWWEHISFVAPGQHSDCKTGISVNGNNWGTWNTPYTLPYNTSQYSVSFKTVQCYYECKIIQSPDLSNGWESIYEFNDDPPGGPHTYELNITFCCAPVINFDDTVKVCKGENIILGPTVVNNTVSYLWTPDSGLSCNKCSNPMVTEWKNRTYYIEGSDSGLCKIKDTLVLLINSPVIDAGKDTALCYGNSITLSAGTSASNSVKWTPSDKLSCDTCNITVASPTGTTKYYVTVKNKTGCKEMDSVTVKVNPLPEIKILNKDTMVCDEDTLLFKATGGIIYDWSAMQCDTISSMCTVYPINPLGGNSDSIVITPQVPNKNNSITYIVEGNDKFGCRNADSIKIIINPPPVVNAGQDTVICKNTPAFLNASGGVQYQWYPTASLNDFSISNPVAFPVSDTRYIVKVSDTNNCFAFDTVTVTIAAPEASFTSDKTKGDVPLTVHFENTSHNATAFHWSFENNETTSVFSFANVSHAYTDTGTFKVVLIATDNYGCSDTAENYIRVSETESALWIPNVFSPNSDNTNDVFTVQSLQINDFKGMIYNRWGELLYEWTDIETGWDGTYKSRKCAEGVYVYIIKAKGKDKQMYSRTGIVALIR